MFFKMKKQLTNIQLNKLLLINHQKQLGGIMRTSRLLLFGLFLFLLSSMLIAQEYVRKEVVVPKVDPAAITIDGQMNEPEWQSAAHADLITATGYETFMLYYYRDGLTEPDFDELYGRMLWAKDTLYVFMHIDEFHNDSTNLYWNGQWTGDQLFVSLSDRMAMEMMGWYDGNSYAAPDGPYHFWILGSDVTLNGGNETYIPEEFRGCYEDSLATFDPSEFVRWGTYIDTTTGVWNVEMAIYNPNVNAQGRLGFNVGGSVGSSYTDVQYGDAYAYYTWQPNIPDDPFGDPYGNGDPGYYNLANSEYWAVLKFEPGSTDIVRKDVTVPKVDPTALTIDGVMNEAAWDGAAHADLITATSYETFMLYYYRDVTEPDFDALYGRMLWAEDTLYVFMHWDEFHNDSTNLFWAGKWTGDQMFVSLTNRLGREMQGWYDGNVYASPDGPFHFLNLGPEMTLNNGDSTYVPEEYRKCFNQSDSIQVFYASNIARWATVIDTNSGVWNTEMAIYHPNVTSQAAIGFNIGGSVGSSYTNTQYGDAYAYFTWQPNIPDDPFGDPYGNGDPGYYNLANSEYWAMLNFSPNPLSVEPQDITINPPTDYNLHQNFPNPFNPTTTIRFDIAQSNVVSLKVYNLLGQVVATLVDGQNMSQGSYQVQWDASNLASGIYLYQLEAGDVNVSRKMILLK
jgi:hypothetical protein